MMIRVPLIALGTVGGILGAAWAVGCGVFSVPKHHGPRTDHFDGTKFRNEVSGENPGFGDVVRWMTHRETGPWREWVDAVPGPPPPRRVDDGRLRVTFINHSTVLVQIDGVNILTDPVYSDRVGPANLVGPKRHRPPGIRFEDLPPIDVVLLSHNHYDHMDLPTLHRLVEHHDPLIITPLGNAAFLRQEGIRVLGEPDWWESLGVGRLHLTCVPARHFSSRGTCDRDAALWGGFVVEAHSGTIYFAGDTGWGPHFQQIRDRFAPLRLALLPIGAYRPRWFMSPVHIDPQDALRAHALLGAATSVAIHFGTFIQADDGEFEPVRTLEGLIVRSPENLAPFLVLEHGEGRDL